MPSEFKAVFSQLKAVLKKYERHLRVLTDKPNDYILASRSTPPEPPHRGRPLYFGAVRLGKAYVSYHFFPVYINAPLAKSVSPLLKKRMQGKSCFNFKTPPEPALLADLKRLTDAGFKQYRAKKWL